MSPLEYKLPPKEEGFTLMRELDKYEKDPYERCLQYENQKCLTTEGLGKYTVAYSQCHIA